MPDIGHQTDFTMILGFFSRGRDINRVQGGIPFQLGLRSVSGVHAGRVGKKDSKIAFLSRDKMSLE